IRTRSCTLPDREPLSHRGVVELPTRFALGFANSKTEELDVCPVGHQIVRMLTARALECRRPDVADKLSAIFDQAANLEVNYPKPATCERQVMADYSRSAPRYPLPPRDSSDSFELESCPVLGVSPGTDDDCDDSSAAGLVVQSLRAPARQLRRALAQR